MINFLKRLLGYQNKCNYIIDEKTCLERQKKQMLKFTCLYCYGIGNKLIKKGEWI